MSPRKRNPLDEEIGRLYALPLEEFIGGRNALAARLKQEGDADASNEVKALRKPTPSAWAVNQLFQRERERMDELLDAGEKARSALHEAITSGGAESLRGAIQEARGLIEDLRQRALEFLAEGGRPASAVMADRIGTNLQSLTFSPAAAEAAERGWIEIDLDPPGFEVLAGLQLAAGGARSQPARPAPRPVKEAPPIRPRPAPVPEKEKKEPEQARPQREEAKAPTRKEREEARLREWREREEARQRAQQEREEARLRERLEAAEAEADRTAAEARGLQEEAAKAARAAAEARRAAEKVQDRADKAAEALARAREALAEIQRGARILSHPGARRRSGKK